MGLFDKFERRLERTVNGAFAKAFRAEVQPVEIASAMRRAMDNRASSIGKNQRPIVPNVFEVELSHGDFERLIEYREELSGELIASALEHVDTQRYTAGGPVAVTFAENTELETGVFHVRSATAKNVDGLEPVVPATSDPAPEVSYDTESPEAAEVAPAAADEDELPPPLSDEVDHDGYDRHSYDQQHEAHEYAGAQEHPQAAALPGSRAQQAPPAHQDSYPVAPAGAQDAAQQPPGGQSPKPVRPRSSAKPRRSPRPWLEIDGERYPLLSAMTVLGRDDSADIILDDPGISRQHSEIRVTNDGPHLVATLRDLGSTNGTFVNGDPISRARLMNGDRITVGRTTMTIHMEARR
ncbi:FhaA domain-containing protein [Dermacoccaceae bacterium W4C1]